MLAQSHGQNHMPQIWPHASPPCLPQVYVLCLWSLVVSNERRCLQGW